MEKKLYVPVSFHVVLVLGVVLSILLVHCVQAESKIKIGAVLPLTGDASSWGIDIKNSILFAHEKLEEKNFEFIFEDDRCIGKNAVAAAHKLIEVDKVDYAMVACSESLISSARLFEDRKIPVIAPVASASAVSNLGDYIFRTWPSDALAAKMLFEYVKHRHKKIGVISEMKGYSQELQKSFSSYNTQGEIQIYNEDFSDFATEGRSILLRMKKNNVEALFLNPNGHDALALMVRQLKEIHFNPTLYGVLIPGGKEFLAHGGADGMVFVDGPSLATFTKQGKTEYDNFVSRFGEIQSSPFVFASTYEAVKLFDAGRVHQSSFISFLLNEKHSGIFGNYIFDRNGDIQGVSHTLKVIKDGEAHEVR